MNALLLLLLIQPVAAVEPEADEAVVAGREALDNWWPRDYPWYDPQADGVRRVEIPKPRDWSWLRDFWEWLVGLLPDWDLSRLWNWLGSFFRWALLSWPTGFWQWTVRIVLLLLLVLLVFWAVWAMRRWGGFFSESAAERRRAAAAASDQQADADRIEALPFPVRRGRLDLLGEARSHYQRGDYGQAIIYLFSFQLVRLDRLQIIRLTKGKTNRQYLREVGRRGVLGRLVEQTMVAFEEVFFGNRTLERARFESCWSRLEEFESLAAEGAG